MQLKDLTRAALIAAVYTAVTLILAPIGFSNIQVRLSEALTMLPLVYFPGVYGITLGCVLSNIIGAAMGVNPLGFIDALVGGLATLLAGLMTYKLRNRKIKNIPLLSMLMPVIFNFVFVGLELAYLYMPDNIVLGLLIFGSEVAVGEIIAVIIGYILVKLMKNRKMFE